MEVDKKSLLTVPPQYFVKKMETNSVHYSPDLKIWTRKIASKSIQSTTYVGTHGLLLCTFETT